MTVCQYFLRGDCRFGDKCKYEHPQNARPQFGNKTWVNNKNNTNEYAYTEDTMGRDLRPGVEKPLWGLSSYGPAKLEPNLISGLDMSFEELRLNAVVALQSNTVAEYMKFEAGKVATADQVYANAFNNLKDAYKQAATNSDNHRTAALPSTSQPSSSTGIGFGGLGSTTGSAFGSGSGTSVFGSGGGGSAFGSGGNGGSTFGSNSFGQTQPKTSVFGQASQPTSTFGGTPGQTGPAFGQPSMPTTTSAFGTTNTPVTSSGAFGGGSGGGFSAFAGTQPSAFGLAAANNTGTSAFSRPQNDTQTTSAFGNTPTNPSVFGQTSHPTSVLSGTGTTNPSQSVFGAPNNTTASVFGATPVNPPSSAFGTPQSTTASAFGTTQNPATTPAFGQTSNPTSSVFGNGNPQQTPAFGQPATLGSGGSQPGTITLSAFGPPPTPAFGVPPQPTPTSAFGITPTNNPLNPPLGSAFGTSQTSSVFGQPTQMNSPFGAQPSSSTFGNPNTSRPVFSAFGSTQSQPVKPDPPKSGPPDFQNAPSKYKPGNCKYDGMLPENYLEILPPDVKAAFEAPKFAWGQVPEWIPPVSFR